MKLNLQSLLSDVQILTSSACGYKGAQRHCLLSYFSAGPLGEPGWCFILPLLSIQNVCGVGMSSEIRGERFTPSLPSFWGCFPKSVSRNGLSAVPAQLGEWDSVTWSSRRNLCFCHSPPSALIVSGCLEVEAGVTRALQAGTGRCDLCAALLS